MDHCHIHGPRIVGPQHATLSTHVAAAHHIFNLAFELFHVFLAILHAWLHARFGTEVIELVCLISTAYCHAHTVRVGGKWSVLHSASSCEGDAAHLRLEATHLLVPRWERLVVE